MSKNARNEELPVWLDAKWFRRTFVTTYMAYVGELTNPWEVSATQAVDAMQRIWDGTSGKAGYKITKTTAVYGRVRGSLVLEHKTNIYIQTVQRLADSWRNVIGSNGVAILLAFFESQDDMKDSDEERQNLAKHLLWESRFAYKDADGEDTSVRFFY